MTRYLLIWFVAACFETHGEVRAVTSSDCYLCHAPQYEATSMPVHGAMGFPTTCADCHRSASWGPALEGVHPAASTYVDAMGRDTTFLLASHPDTKCLACHDLDVPPPPDPKPRGYNANCNQCHPNDAYQQNSHAGRAYVSPVAPYQYEAAIPNFCLVCHPQGTAHKHPRDRFSIAGHHDVPCLQCHHTLTDATRANSYCTACHGSADRQHEESSYTRVKSNPGIGLTSENFCLASGCHPDGRKHGD